MSEVMAEKIELQMPPILGLNKTMITYIENLYTDCFNSNNSTKL